MQTLPQLLPSVEMGTTQRIELMTIKQMIFSYTILGLSAIVGVMLAVNGLHEATATQCLQHDWPVQAHQIHMDWCVDNNYPTN